MSFWARLFGGARADSVALIDIGSTSIGGAYACIKEGAPPVIVYTARVPVEPHRGEPPAKAMERALTLLGDTLIKEGAPSLMREAGTGRVGRVLVSIAPPWQDTSMRVERWDSEKPFVFTNAMLKEALAKSSIPAPGHVIVDELVIGVRLNGYDVSTPVGVRAKNASVLILVSSVDYVIGERVAQALRRLYHTHQIHLIASQACRYRALTALFPHQREYLIVDALSEPISFALVRRGVLLAVEEEEDHHAPAAHLSLSAHVFESGFGALAKRYPLPHTILLLAPLEATDFLKEALLKEPLNMLWLSAEPPSIIPITPGQFSELVTMGGQGEPDLALFMLALASRERG